MKFKKWLQCIFVHGGYHKFVGTTFYKQDRRFVKCKRCELEVETE